MMAKAADSKIETTLRTVVRDALKRGEEVTVKIVRQRTEKKLGLDDGFLKEVAWRKKSKGIIEEALEEPEEDAQPESAERVKESAPKPQKKSKKNDEQAKAVSASQTKATAPAPKPPQKTAPQVNGVKRKASESETISRSGSRESVSSGKQAPEQSPNKRAKVDASAAPKKSPEQAVSSSSSDESSEEGSDNEESGSSDSDREEDADKTPSPTQAAETEHKEALQPIPSKPFKPPSGYTPVDPGLLSANGPLSDANLQGKQVWHITAPSSVPISSLTELALSSIRSGEAVLSHNGVAYVLNEDKTTGAESTALLAPSKSGYQKPRPKISRTLHLQQKIDLPNLSALQASQMAGSNAAGDVAQAPVSTVRPQPKGLRMRYKPPGFGKGRPGRIGSGSESGDDQHEEGGPSFQFPKTLGQHGVEVRQTGDVEMVDAADVEGNGDRGKESEKKAKKKRKEKDGHGDGGQPKVNGISNHETPAQKVPSAKTPALTTGTVGEKESKEERRKRKEEKRARKEAKAKAV